MSRPGAIVRLAGVAVLACLVFGEPLRAAQKQAASPYITSAEDKFRAGDLDGAIADLTRAIAVDPRSATLFSYRAYIRMQKGRAEDAIADYTQAIALDTSDPGDYAFRGALKHVGKDPEGAIVDSRRAIALNPATFLAYKTLLVIYREKAYPGASLSAAEKGGYVALAAEAGDHALQLAPDDIETLINRGIIYRLAAGLETDPAKQRELIKQATALSDKAQRLRQEGATLLNPLGLSAPVPPLPPPPPPPAAPLPPAAPAPPAAAPLRTGGDIPMPKKTKDVPPVYPAIAQSARIQGVVILDATIGPDGKVTDLVVVKSIPLLDEAAIHAVRQWEYTPTFFRGIPVSVIMAITVTFTLK